MQSGRFRGGATFLYNGIYGNLVFLALASVWRTLCPSPEGRIYLNYTPHKTAHSSRREVRWPVHADLWRHLRDASFDFDESVFAELNRQMRALGFTGTKGAYELRKICIDHVYQKFGAEMAVSISGDDIKTITHYYADPAQPNIGHVRVVDLL